jgi:hypothetical protein
VLFNGGITTVHTLSARIVGFVAAVFVVSLFVQPI